MNQINVYHELVISCYYSFFRILCGYPLSDKNRTQPAAVCGFKLSAFYEVPVREHLPLFIGWDLVV